MSLIGLVVMLIVIGLVLWGIEQLPLDAMIQKVIRGLVIVVAVLWVLQAFGLLSGTGLHLR